MDRDAAPFRLLLGEDDPVSREFLGEALRALGAAVTARGDGFEVLDLARSGAWDLLLLDHHLPGLTGDAILAALNAGRNHGTPPAAIAITAAPEDKAMLLRAGFIDVLPKPITVEQLATALQRHGFPVDGTLDDHAALRACGSATTVARLRRLFADDELPAILAEIDHCGDDPACLRPTLHRLRASCGFCGAPSLAAAGETLHRALTHGSRETIASALGAFRTAVLETRNALRAQSCDQP